MAANTLLSSVGNISKTKIQTLQDSIAFVKDEVPKLMNIF